MENEKVENNEKQTTLQSLTPDEALKKLEEEEAARQKAYEEKYVNKFVTDQPTEFYFIGPPRNPNGYQKMTREEINSIISRLYKKGLLRKQQRRFVWIPISSKTLMKLSELGERPGP